MQNVATQWRRDGEWKARYSKLYSTRRLSIPKEDETNRISFLSNESTPYTSLLVRMRTCAARARPDTSRGEGPPPPAPPPSDRTWLSQQSDLYKTAQNSQQASGQAQAQAQGGADTDTLLLELVRARNRTAHDEALDSIRLPRDDVSEDDTWSEACVHGLSMRMTERSVSRSRVSRVSRGSRGSRGSTRRDMDIPSILAVTTNITAQVPLENVAFKKRSTAEREREGEGAGAEVPRWSVRRAACPVCSQKWKDRSSVTNVKYSGLKRNSALDLPSVIAPARLRTSITMDYVPRPALAVVDEDAGLGHVALRNTSASWQLTRARRFRAPRPQAPPGATAPHSSTAPLARKDLDIRVNRFLTDEEVKLIV